MPAAGQGVHVATVIDDRPAVGGSVRRAISNDTLGADPSDSVHHAPESGASIRNRADMVTTRTTRQGHRRAADLPQREDSPVTATTEPFELPVELAIDTDVARRVIGGVHPRAAPPGRLRADRARPVGRDRFGPGRVPGRRGDRSRAAAAVLMPYRTSSPASRADAETVDSGARLLERGRRDHGDGRRILLEPSPRSAPPATKA